MKMRNFLLFDHNSWQMDQLDTDVKIVITDDQSSEMSLEDIPTLCLFALLLLCVLLNVFLWCATIVMCFFMLGCFVFIVMMLVYSSTYLVIILYQFIIQNLQSIYDILLHFGLSGSVITFVQ